MLQFIKDFWFENWANILLIVVGTFAFVKKKDRCGIITYNSN